jgi:ubiquinone/menaquinone biosynthesis C-methylase UbiE
MSDVINFNIHVHTVMAEHYDSNEPHFRPENKEKVSSRLSALRAAVPGGKLLDVGCGTGFIVDLAKPHFASITGVDVTPAMMGRINTADHDVTLIETSAETLPLEDQSFDAATAYSVLDHLENPDLVLAEVARVLKPGGQFYLDLAPNYFFWEALQKVQGAALAGSEEFVAREARMVSDNAKLVEQEYGIAEQVFIDAEPGKKGGGIDPYAFQALALKNGFSKAEIHFDWFLGNGKVLHEDGAERANMVMEYLQDCLPVSRHLFKYVWFVFTK